MAEVTRRIVQLVFVVPHHIAIEHSVVPQHRSRQRVTVGTESQKAAELEYGMAHLARALVDHQIVDRSDLPPDWLWTAVPSTLSEQMTPLAGDDVFMYLSLGSKVGIAETRCLPL